MTDYEQINTEKSRVVTNAEEAVAEIGGAFTYPIIITPWQGDQTNKTRYVANNAGELKEYVTKALEDSVYESKVDLVSKSGQTLTSGPMPKANN